MDGTKITRQREGQMESYMVATKITSQRHRRADEQINGRHENNSPKDGELNGWHENKGWTAQNNSPKGWTGGELNGLHENNLPKPQRDGRTKS